MDFFTISGIINPVVLPTFLSSRCCVRTITLNFVINEIKWCGAAIAIGILYFFDILCEIFASLMILSPEISS